MIRLLDQKEELPWHLLLDADPQRDIVEGYIHQSEVRVLELDKKVVGCIVFQIRPNEAELMNVAVDSDYQRQGLGAKLIQYALKIIGEKKPFTPFPVLVKTGNSTLPALALYKSQGFKERQRIKNYFLTHYSKPIYEEGILLTDQIILSQTI